MFLPASRKCPETQDGLTQPPKPHVCHPSESSGSSLQVVVRTTVRLHGLQLKGLSKSFVFLITFVETPSQEHTDALCCCCSCKATFIAVLFFITSRSVLGSPHCRRFIVSTQRVPASNSSSYTSSKTFQEIDLFLTSLLLRRHCHALVSLKETFRRCLRAVTHFVSLLKS